MASRDSETLVKDVYEGDQNFSMNGLRETEGYGTLIRILIIAVGNYHFGYYIGIFNPLADPMLKYTFKIESESERAAMQGNINMFLTVGAMISVFFCGKLMNMFGRIRLITYIEIGHLLVYILHCFKSYPLLLLARFLSGVFLSTHATIGTVAIKEMMPSSRVAHGGVLLYIFLVFFLFLSSFANTVYNNDKELIGKNFRVLLVWPIIICIPRIILMLVYFKFN